LIYWNRYDIGACACATTVPDPTFPFKYPSATNWLKANRMVLREIPSSHAMTRVDGNLLAGSNASAQDSLPYAILHLFI